MVGSSELFGVLLGMGEDGDTFLVYGCEVYKKHVEAACPAVRLLGGALYVGVWCFFA